MIRKTLVACVTGLALSLSGGLLQAAPPPVTAVPLAEVAGMAVPSQPYWAVAEVVVAAGQRISHQHGLEFVYALAGEAAVTMGRETVRLAAGKAMAVPAGILHTHLNPGGEATRMISLVLAPAEGSWGELQVVRVRRSGPLAGIRPGRQQARLLDVTIQPLSESAVHSHPGPEGVYVLEGPIVLQREGALAVLLRGDLFVVPGDTPVQVRYNRGSGLGRLLAPYVVAEGAPFSVAIPGGFTQPP